MTKFLLVLVKCFFLIVFTNLAHADKLTEESAKDLINNMYAAITTLNSKDIERFINFYVTQDAEFRYNIIGSVGSSNKNSNIKQDQQVKTFQGGRKEFTKYLIKRLKYIVYMSYDLKIDSFKASDDNTSAIVSINVEQDAKSWLPGTKFIGETVSVTTKITSNCNVALSLAVSGPLISGMSCAEVITVG